MMNKSYVFQSYQFQCQICRAYGIYMLTQGRFIISISTMCCIGGRTWKKNALICMLDNHELCPDLEAACTDWKSISVQTKKSPWLFDKVWASSKFINSWTHLILSFLPWCFYFRNGKIPMLFLIRNGWHNNKIIMLLYWGMPSGCIDKLPTICLI